MAATDYNERVRALFADPRHVGRAAGPGARVERGGQAIELSAVVRDGRLAELRFRVFGCPHLVAAAEEFCDEFEGRPPADLQRLRCRELLAKLEIPVEKTGRILLLEDAVAALARKLGTAAATDDWS